MKLTERTDTIAEKHSEELYLEAESTTNRDNTACLLVCALIMIICGILNEIGVFKVADQVMRLGVASGVICYMIPSFVMIAANVIHRNKLNDERVFRKPWYTSMLIISSWLGTFTACILFTHHTVIAMAIPVMIMAQYRTSKKLIAITLVSATLCALLGVYAGYYIGCFDANLIQVALSDTNGTDFAMRAELTTPHRIYELFTHYFIPREFIVLALVFLATRISKRNERMLAKQLSLQITVEQEMKRTSEIQVQIINGMVNLIENRDASTGEHVKRTGFYVGAIAAEMQKSCGLTDAEVEDIIKAAPLHDIGKIVVTDAILQKPGRLTPDEYDRIKVHAAKGAKIIDNILGNIEDEAFLSIAEQISAGHHERWDGKGYPDGLKGNDIPLAARIMAVADVFDALVSKRVYKDAMPVDDAFALIESEAGKQFDPDVVAAFVRLKPVVREYLSAVNQ